MRNNADDLTAGRRDQLTPPLPVNLNDSPVDLTSRKRAAASGQLIDSVSGPTPSQKVSRHLTGDTLPAPETQTKYADSREPPAKPRVPAQSRAAHHSQKRVQRPPASFGAKPWPRLSGPNVCVNDNIKAFKEHSGSEQQTSKNLSFPQPVDGMGFEDNEVLTVNSSILNQPDARPISQQQLAAEVKGIYCGLVMVENKCVNVISAQSQAIHQAESGDEQARYSLRIDHFQALIALHRTLLHEHHDFFHASQHPSAGPQIKDLALRYSMPARMWKHGIHNFLELLRHRLPESLDYMLAFLYLAYQMMALLYETVPSFEDTWIECLGDLGRYRMAIEDADPRDREVWTGVARFWYMKAVDKNPNIGRLYRTCAYDYLSSLVGHIADRFCLDHLAILARNRPVQQASSYCRSLTAIQPFLSSRESIMTLFEPIISRARNPGSKPVSGDTWFIVCLACLFRVRDTASLLVTAMHNFLSQLDAQISKENTKWREHGAFIATCIIGSLLKFGSSDSHLRRLLSPEERSSSKRLTTGSQQGLLVTTHTCSILIQTLQIKIGVIRMICPIETSSTVKEHPNGVWRSKPHTEY